MLHRAALIASALLALSACSGAHKDGEGAKAASGQVAPADPAFQVRRVEDARSVAWDAQHTYVVMVTLLEWPEDRLGSFPKEGRKDFPFRDLLVERGVRPENVLTIADENATAANIRTQMKAFLQTIPEGSTLLFYYAGHGLTREELYDPAQGQTRTEFFFANYDIDNTDDEAVFRTGVSGREIVDLIATEFKGDKAIIFADCCYSGLLTELMKESPSRARFASIVSVDPENVSTGNWTFTETLIAAFEGHSAFDENSDGVVSFSETLATSKRIMKDDEYQEAWGSWGISSQADLGFAFTDARPGDDEPNCATPPSLCTDGPDDDAVLASRR